MKDLPILDAAILEDLGILYILLFYIIGCYFYMTVYLSTGNACMHDSTKFLL